MLAKDLKVVHRYRHSLNARPGTTLAATHSAAGMTTPADPGNLAYCRRTAHSMAASAASSQPMKPQRLHTFMEMVS
jgi:hypothetical protein